MLRTTPFILMFLVCIALIHPGVSPVSAQTGQTKPDIDYSNYVGVYENPNSTCSVLIVDNDALMLQLPSGIRAELIIESPTLFPMKAFPSIKLSFTLDRDGHATDFVMIGMAKTNPPSVRTTKTVPRYTAVTLKPQIMKKYTGYYRGADGITVRVQLEKNKMYVDSAQIDFDEIRPESRTVFFSPTMFFKYSFVEDSNGNVVLMIRQLGNSTTSYDNVSKEIEGKTTGSLSSATLKSYAGKYREASNCFLVFTTDGEHLFMPGTSKKDVELLPESESTFFRLHDGVRFTFVKNSSGAVTHVLRKAGDSEAKFELAAIGGNYKSGSPIPPDSKIDLVINGLAGTPALGINEGACWADGKLYFSDQLKGVFVWDGGAYRHLVDEYNTCGTAALPNGNIAVCDIKNKRVVEISPDGTLVKVLADRDHGLPEGNPNDLTADAKGGMYVTVNDFSGQLEKSNVVVYISPGGTVSTLTEYRSIPFPNGIALSPDGSKLYISGTMKKILAFDINDDGSLSNRRDFAELSFFENKFGANNPILRADGMQVDSSGNLYVTTTREGVQVFNKQGELIDIIPIIGVSNCTFGGPGMSTLYITYLGPNVAAVKTNSQGFQNPRK